MGNLFKKDDDIQLTPDKEQFQLDIGKALSDRVLKYLPGYEPGKEYSGQRTAGMSSQEQQSLALLDQLLGSSGGDLTKQAKGEVSRLLGSQIDPSVDPRYRYLRSASQTNLQDAIDEANRSAASRGSFFSTGAIRDENRLREQNLNYLNQVLGQLYGEEAGRRFQAIGLAPQLDAAGDSLLTNRIAAGQQYGALPRVLEQSDLEAKYQDFLRKQQEYAGVPAVGQNVFGTSITYGQKTIPGTSPFERMIGPIAQLAGTAIGGAVGSPIGATAGGSLGGAAGTNQKTSTTNITNRGLGSQQFLDDLLKPFSYN